MSPALSKSGNDLRKGGVKNLVFEIGSEELPATNLADIFESAAAEKTENVLKTKWKKTFEDNRIGFQRAEVWATPRRLVFYLEGVSPSQTPRDQLTKLMAQAEAYGADGQPAEKLLTILRHRNVTLAETVISDLNGKPHVFIKKAEPVQKTATVLPIILEAFVPGLSFPKNMKWDDSGLYFPRPIRSTLCFYGSECVKFKVGNTRSGDKLIVFSKGKRSVCAVSDVAGYFRVLKKENICLDPEERKKTIQSILEKLAKSFHGKLYDDPFLLSEVNFLVENPQGLSAPFNDEFLKLPMEVLTVSMARKQRIFGLVDKDQNVLPRFLAIADRPMSEKERKLISLNYENILHAKLQDSLFFYREDLKVSLEKRREELKNLIFLKGAGSMLEKSERLVALVRHFADAFSLSNEERTALERAARLSKSDLLTQMVGEFPELQGVVGKYYAKESGESNSVASAIGEQYLPRTISDPLPNSKIGAILSLLDKADLIVACFLLKIEPSSSADPYGLRRSGNAIVRMALEKKFNINLADLVRFNASLFHITGVAVEDKLCGEKGFFWDRFRAVYASELGGDVIDAATASGYGNFIKVYERAKALKKMRHEVYFKQACKVIERTTNILKGNKEALPAKPDAALFAEPLEHAVLAKLEQHSSGIENAKKEGDFGRATSLYAEAFFDILNEFFDKVFINAEDLNVRKNRLSLLRNVKELYTRDVADLSKIQEKI